VSICAWAQVFKTSRMAMRFSMVRRYPNGNVERNGGCGNGPGRWRCIRDVERGARCVVDMDRGDALPSTGHLPTPSRASSHHDILRSSHPGIATSAHSDQRLCCRKLIHAQAAKAAVSVRRRALPIDTAVKPSARNRSASSTSKSPSGPISTSASLEGE